ncbi:Cytochrome c [Bryocella elongata]|uniref:Cytochrome c n=1 Tax=Bryocella elongata TaxID=863522 RepID=A0A1H5TBR4_9BACT|nr:cytochrome ubiquinol oxidase subunit I [Bryocella elongata]SEF59447.1 Cytochrome c [Bryocella elongata]
MNYPFWDIPHLGSGWVIGLIAIYHVMISQFAVGGGLYLPMAERKALKLQDPTAKAAWLEQLHKHSKFFLLITGVFGTVSGVGIWFAIGLTQPEATSTLIHNFVFGWAMEWVFFMLELTTVAVYYYTWDRIPEKLHLKVGWLYAGFSAATLIIINGILTFMLTPGDTWIGVAGTGREASVFWNAFFNPTYWPSLFLRTCVCLSLAGIWALITASRLDGDKQPALKTAVVKYSTKWLIPSFLATPILMVWYVAMVPASQRAILSLGIDTIGAGTFSVVTRIALVIIITSAAIIGVTYYTAYRSPRDFSLSHAIAILLLALAATGSGEYGREMLRKPYVIGRWMYSNGVRVPHVATINHDGYLAHTNWVWNGQTDSSYSRGEAIFRGECMSCHTLDGYRSMRKLMEGRDGAAIESFVQMLHDYKPDSPYRRYMPPMSGTDQDVKDLANYLNSQINGAGGPPPLVTAGKLEAPKPPQPLLTAHK